MRVLGRDRLDRFMKKHRRSEDALKAWLAHAEAAQWIRWADIKAQYPSADLISGKTTGHRVVFNIKGNHFRLAVQVYFNRGTVVVERVGTHAEYDKWNF